MNADVNSATISYDESKELARHQDPGVRAALARRTDLRPEILYFLAEDTDEEVRRIVANNTAAPHQTDLILVKDGDDKVRAGLASKIATAAPGLSANEQDKVRKSTHAVLELLAKDQIKVVRQVLADVIKDVADAPVDIIKTLAGDVEIDVSGPVLEHSPVLTDDDLVEIIETSAAEGALNAIARRNNLQHTVADAIVASDDNSAISDLLGNNSAQIREQTINDLIDRAPGVELWHQPLVARTTLPNGAAVRMARFLADNLLSELQERSDMDAATLRRVKSVVEDRLGNGSDMEQPISQAAQDFLKVDPPLNMVMRLFNARKLDSEMVEKALMSSDHGFVFAALVVKAGIEPDVGKTIFKEQNPKGILSLCWKAHLPAKMAGQVQQRMGRIPPADVVAADSAQEYPLSDEEMNWQLEFFREMTMKIRRT